MMQLPCKCKGNLGLILAIAMVIILLAAFPGTTTASSLEEDTHSHKHTVKERNKDFEYSASWLFNNLVSGGSVVSDYTGPPSPLLVIGAGLPRTGTASFQKAMSMLGFNCYHFYKVVQTNGHFATWYNYLVKGSQSFEEVIAQLSHDGYNATVDTPVALQYEKFVQQYPNAKVVLTQRSEVHGGAKWAKSMTTTNLKYQAVTKYVPWKWIPALTRATDFLKAQHDYSQLPRLHHDQLPAFYDSWNDKVMQTVPPENLLIFSAKDGWEPLCEFLSPVSDIVQMNCDKILASKEPYPRVNDSALIESVIATCETITLLVQFVPVVLVVLVAGVLIMKRRHTTAASASAASGKPKKQ